MLAKFIWCGYSIIVDTYGGCAIFLLGGGKAFVSRIYEGGYFHNCNDTFRFEIDTVHEKLTVTGTIEVLDKVL